MKNSHDGMPLSPSQKEPIATAEILHEAKACLIREQIENELAGKEGVLGIFAKIQNLSTQQEERVLAKELGSLIWRSGLLFLAGYTEVATLGVTNFRAAHQQFKERQSLLDKQDPSQVSIPLKEEAHCATVLEYALRLITKDANAGTQLQIIESFSVADYSLLKEDVQEEKFKFLANRVLKTRLHAYLAETVLEGRLTELPQEISEPAFVLETNDLFSASLSHYEEDLFETLNWDAATRQRLTQKYNSLAGDTYHERDGMREGGLCAKISQSLRNLHNEEHINDPSQESVNTLKEFAGFEKDWLQLQLELARLPRKSG